MCDRLFLKKTQVILKQQFTVEKGFYVNDSTKKYRSTPYLLSRIALRLLKIIEPYLVEQNRMANAQLLGYGSTYLGTFRSGHAPDAPPSQDLVQWPKLNLAIIGVISG
jgi:hypothetical protein